MTSTQLVGLVPVQLRPEHDADRRVYADADRRPQPEQIGNLTSTELNAFTVTQFAAVTGPQMGALTASQINNFADTRIGDLTPAQLAGMTSTQFSGFSTTLIAPLTVDTDRRADAAAGVWIYVDPDRQHQRPNSRTR